MTGKMKLLANGDGTYDVVVQYDKKETEFALEFLSKARIKNNYENIRDFVRKNGKNIRVRSVRLMVGGVIIATISMMSLFHATAAPAGKYSMTYLYGGTVSQQIGYVERTNNSIGTVSPSYYDINTDGSLKINPISTQLVDSMHTAGIKVVPFLSNHWDRGAGQKALQNPLKLADEIAASIESNGLDGVNVDIENVTETSRAAYTELVKGLREKIPADKEVSVAVAANPAGWQTGWHGSYDYKELAANSDYLMIMTYDEHYEGGTPGPVASIDFVRGSVNYALKHTTPDKIVVGLPFFGRIWSLDDNKVVGKGVGISAVNNMIESYNAVVTFDEASKSPKAEFTVKGGDKQYTVGGQVLAPGKYVVWYENDESFREKLNLVSQYGLKGAGSWAIGQEDTSVWKNYSNWLNGSDTGTPDISTPTTDGNEKAVTPEVTTPPQVVTPPQVTPPQITPPPVTVTPPPVIVAPPSVTVTPPPAPTRPAQQTPSVTQQTPAAVSQVTESITAYPGWVTPKTKTLNIRRFPGVKYDVIGKLSGGSSIQIMGEPVNGFYAISLGNGQIGYVSAKYVTTVEPSRSIKKNNIKTNNIKTNNIKNNNNAKKK